MCTGTCTAHTCHVSPQGNWPVAQPQPPPPLRALTPLSLSPCALCSPMDDISDPVYDVPVERSTKQLPTPPVAWKDPRFQPAIDSVRNTCGFVTNDR